LLAAHWALSLSMMTMGIVGASIAFVATFLLPETAGRDLRDVDGTIAEIEHAQRHQDTGDAGARAPGAAR
jgi:hypothetical protein